MFQYREYAEQFSKQIRKTIKDLEYFPQRHQKTQYKIQSHSIYMCAYNTYLIFYSIEETQITVIRVLKDRMFWQSIIENTHNI